jgi:hypothetical protein
VSTIEFISWPEFATALKKMRPVVAIAAAALIYAEEACQGSMNLR